MATKAKAKKVMAKKTVAKKPAAKKAAVKKVVAKKTLVKKANVKAAVKSTVKPGSKKIEVKKPMAVVAPKPVASTPSVAPVASSKKGFAVGEYVVYPTHGVGRIMGIEAEKIGEYELKVFVINFEKDKMTLRVPLNRAEAAGLRSISPNDQISRAITTLKGRAKIARGMWSRRAQEYESKINSGNLVQIAEVVRDLHKNVDQSERSYSERMIYETAMHRLVGEVAASERVDVKAAHDKLLKVLRKQAA
ncbi:MAG: CarD family transcriptional regulator [Alphaproteobacteria bacterium]|nr:CarD family transcriptional regulator [Alphaproteobacteria bacterium]